nr:Biomphalaria glabrata DNA annealing helicase and endonuclease ZRANB3-like; transcript variant X4 [Biomphalaria glabrata]
MVYLCVFIARDLTAILSLCPQTVTPLCLHCQRPYSNPLLMSKTVTEDGLPLCLHCQRPYSNPLLMSKTVTEDGLPLCLHCQKPYSNPLLMSSDCNTSVSSLPETLQQSSPYVLRL